MAETDPPETEDRAGEERQRKGEKDWEHGKEAQRWGEKDRPLLGAAKNDKHHKSAAAIHRRTKADVLPAGR